MATPNSFESAAQRSASRGATTELLEFLRDQKRIWMAPIIAALLLLGLLAFLSTTGAAPFIYTLF
jgi:hypothetical protein